MKKTENALLSEISLGLRADVDFYYFCWMSFSYLGVIANQQELSGNCGLLAKINTITYINFILPLFEIIIIIPCAQAAKFSYQSYHIRLTAAQTFSYLRFLRWFTPIKIFLKIKSD